MTNQSVPFSVGSGMYTSQIGKTQLSDFDEIIIKINSLHNGVAILPGCIVRTAGGHFVTMNQEPD